MDVKVYGVFGGIVADASTEAHDVMTHPALPGLDIGVSYFDETAPQIGVFISMDEMAPEFKTPDGAPIMQVALGDRVLYDTQPGALERPVSGDEHPLAAVLRTADERTAAERPVDVFASSRGPDGVVGQDADHLEAIGDAEAARAETGELHGDVTFSADVPMPGYVKAANALMEYDADSGNNTDPETAMADLICDLMIVAKMNGVSDPETIVERAIDYWRNNERQEPEPDREFLIESRTVIRVQSIEDARDVADRLASATLADAHVLTTDGSVRPTDAE